MKVIRLFIIIPLLGGCTNSQETFDCPAGSGVGCKSIVEVNEMINQGELTSETPGGDVNVRKGTRAGTRAFIATPPLKGAGVIRHPEIPLRVFMAGFEDEEGNFHEGGYVHTILKTASWGTNSEVNEPAQEPAHD